MQNPHKLRGACVALGLAAVLLAAPVVSDAAAPAARPASQGKSTGQAPHSTTAQSATSRRPSSNAPRAAAVYAAQTRPATRQAQSELGSRRSSSGRSVVSSASTSGWSTASTAQTPEGKPLQLRTTRGSVLNFRVVIGRTKDLTSDNIGPDEGTLLPYLRPGLPGQNWERNADLLLTAIKQGKPIRDASPGDNDGAYLNRERQLLRDSGWTFNARNSHWEPPAAAVDAPPPAP